MAPGIEHGMDFAQALAFEAHLAVEPAPRTDFSAIVKAFESQIASTTLDLSTVGDLIGVAQPYDAVAAHHQYRVRDAVRPAPTLTPFDM
jgi:hypothetical protein